MLKSLDIPPAVAAFSVGVAIILLVVSYALFTGWNPDQLPYAIRFVQAAIAAVLAAGAFVVAVVGVVRYFRKVN